MLTRIVAALLSCSLPLMAAPIVFQGYVEGSPKGILSVDSSGGEISVLDAAGIEPSLSSDGSRLIYVGQGGVIATMNVDGSDRRSLGIQGRQPSWSMDESKIAFVELSRLFTTTSDGQQITEVVPRASQFYWSPSGSDEIYYSVGFNIDGHAIRKVNLATGDTTDVLFGAFIPITTYPFSPSGSALITNQARSGYHMRILDLLTGQMDEIGPSGPEGPQSAAWSPDGTMIAYDVRGGTKGLFVSGPNGEMPRLVVPGEFTVAPFAPAWSPDGSMLAFHMRNYNGGPNRLHVVNLDGGEVTFIGRGSFPHWSPISAFGSRSDAGSSVESTTWGKVKIGEPHR